MKRVILGIDAAWSLTQPSGVAVAVGEGGQWRLLAVEASYSCFINGRSHLKPAGSSPDARELLSAAADKAQAAVDLVAIDMPLSRLPITARRRSDNAISSAYGAKHCATHSPSSVWPGVISDRLRADFTEAGYPLLTDGMRSPGLIEVYPHPALVELAQAPRRLPYKSQKTAQYWPELSLGERRARLLDQWAQIIKLLDDEIEGVAELLPVPDLTTKGAALKAFEDKLDAIVCAWVGICVLEDRATAFGDDDSAIWVPTKLTRELGSSQPI